MDCYAAADSRMAKVVMHVPGPQAAILRLSAKHQLNQGMDSDGVIEIQTEVSVQLASGAASTGLQKLSQQSLVPKLLLAYGSRRTVAGGSSRAVVVVGIAAAATQSP